MQPVRFNGLDQLESKIRKILNGRRYENIEVIAEELRQERARLNDFRGYPKK
jgi:hypothetical protein